MAAMPNLRNASDNGEISATVNFAAIGVNEAVKIRNITVSNFFIRVYYHAQIS
jgi:hypothetical protein